MVYYIYFTDPTYGLCHLRVLTWAPFRLQFYLNGHNWIANKLAEQNIGTKQIDGTFLSIDNWEATQRLAGSFSVGALHRELDFWAY